MKLIIVEGPDCSGKTTLARYIATTSKGVVVHMDCNKALQTVMPEYQKAVIDGIAANIFDGDQRCLVLDRCWPSEWVYAGLLRPHFFNRFPFDEFRIRLNRLNAHYIYCTDSDELLLERHKSHGEHHGGDDIDEEQYLKIVHRYEEWYQRVTDHGDIAAISRYSVSKNGHDLAGYIYDTLYASITVVG